MRTAHIPFLCSSLSHSTIAQRAVCASIFLLYAMLCGLIRVALPHPGLQKGTV